LRIPFARNGFLFLTTDGALAFPYLVSCSELQVFAEPLNEASRNPISLAERFGRKSFDYTLSVSHKPADGEFLLSCKFAFGTHSSLHDCQ
jgi:hypothetical protein